MKISVKHKLRNLAGSILALLFAVLGTFQLTTTAAAANEGMTMSPVSKHYELKPGETSSDTLLVINHGKTDYTFKIIPKGFDVDSDTYLTLTDNLKNPMADIGQWVSFSQTTYHLKAGENAIIPYTIIVPQKVTPGAHTGAIYAEIQPEETEGIVVKKSVGVVLYANVGGDYIKQGSVENISIPFYQPLPPLEASARFLNTGTAYYIGREEVKVYDVFGKQIAEQSKEFTVLPDRPRKVGVSLDNVNPVGLYKVTVMTKVFDQEKAVSGYVLLVPLWLIIFIPVAIVVFVLFLQLRRRRKVVHFQSHK